MTISVGDRVPSATLKQMTADGPQDLSTEALFAGKKVVVFGLPGAFTPTCSAKHVPGFLEHVDEIKGKGVDTVACVSVNDAFVMGAWGKDQGVGDKIQMLADGSCGFTKAIGLDIDLSSRGLGTRSSRYAMVVDDGVVTSLEVESSPAELSVSSAESVLAKL
jgi:peroxiredoxin